jgi:hypothetical protein
LSIAVFLNGTAFCGASVSARNKYENDNSSRITDGAGSWNLSDILGNGHVFYLTEAACRQSGQYSSVQVTNQEPACFAESRPNHDEIFKETAELLKLANGALAFQ